MSRSLDASEVAARNEGFGSGTRLHYQMDLVNLLSKASLSSCVAEPSRAGARPADGAAALVVASEGGAAVALPPTEGAAPSLRQALLGVRPGGAANLTKALKLSLVSRPLVVAPRQGAGSEALPAAPLAQPSTPAAQPLP